MSESVRSKQRRAFRRDVWFTLAPVIAVVGLAFAVTLLYVKPAPPKRLVLASAPDEGGARYYARRYQEILKRDGVTLELRTTPGSQTNVALLADPKSGVDVAFAQSGTDGGEKAAHVVSLGALNYTPLWVVLRGEGGVEDLHQLLGKRISVGPQDSGTRALAMTLLTAAGVEKEPTTLVSLDRDAAIEALKKGDVDAMFLCSPAESPVVKRLAGMPGMTLLSFDRADAYVRRFPYLRKLVLPRGVFDLGADIPERDITVVSPTVNLLARDSLHPALAYLLMRAASEVHASAGLLDETGEFPAPREAGFPLSSEAKRYYTAGVPFLQRYLPFWAANLVDRLWVMLVPIIAVLVPLGRLLPALYRWRVRSRVFRWYARLKQIELQLEERPTRDRLDDMLRRLDEMERAVNAIPTPLAYAENLYFFREHVEVVRRRILRELGGELVVSTRAL